MKVLAQLFRVPPSAIAISYPPQLDSGLSVYCLRTYILITTVPNAKLIDATERWSSNIKQPPENPEYDLSRKLALEAIRDIREEAARLVEDQKTWFAAHPPAKEPENVPTREVPR